MEFTGRFDTEAFGDFARHRADRLDLSLRFDAAGPTRFAVEVAGEPDLIDAFEMACSLGPLSCLVLDVSRTATDGASS